MKSNVLQFVTLDSVWLIRSDTGQDDNKITNFKLNFDYETIITTQKSYLYFYIEIEADIATLQTRSVFEYEKKNDSSEHIFDMEYILPSLSLAFKEAREVMIQKCGHYAEREGFLPEMSADRLEAMAKVIVSEYNDLRKEEDMLNALALNTLLLDCTFDHPYAMVFETACIILDNVLYINPDMNKEHNREVFFSRVPFQKYVNLKHKCYAIGTENISLSLFESVFFFICLDCALQVLMGDKSEEIIRSIEVSDEFGAEYRNLFIKYGSDMLVQMKNAVREGGFILPDLEQDYNWISRIK